MYSISLGFSYYNMAIFRLCLLLSGAVPGSGGQFGNLYLRFHLDIFLWFSSRYIIFFVRRFYITTLSLTDLFCLCTSFIKLLVDFSPVYVLDLPDPVSEHHTSMKHCLTELSSQIAIRHMNMAIMQS